MAKSKRKPTDEEKALNNKIKEQKLNKAKVELPKDSKVDFDGWHSMRRSKIGAQHHKEVLLVYMKSIGLSEKETVECYDKALERYGVKLK